MYIIEKIIKLYLSTKSKNKKINTPKFEGTNELEDVITCKHTFMPIDSTGKILACSKCGYLITKERLKNKH